jgi:hypothetical protein
MYKMVRRNRLSTFVTRTTTIVVFSSLSTFCLHAQQSAGTSASLPPISLKKSLAAPLNLSVPDDLNYSSSVGAAETSSAENFKLGGSEENQPPPRRRYGRRPVYNDSTHNADGSNKYTFAVGGGFTLPVGITHKDLTTSWNIQASGGRNFNKTYGLLLEFDYANFGLQGNTIANQKALYQFIDPVDNFTGLDGKSHVWSFTLDPIINYYTSDTWGAYAIGGIGFYHKTANFTLPGTGVYCDYYGFCYRYNANYNIDNYVSNAFGVNAGLGFTYKLSRFGAQKLYGEARYVWTDNQPRAFSYAANNLFPANSNRTSYIPVTFGIRW